MWSAIVDTGGLTARPVPPLLTLPTVVEKRRQPTEAWHRVQLLKLKLRRR
jgi:hypothetical protein